MLRLLIVTFLTVSLPFSTFAQSDEELNQVSIVALIITSGGETPVSASVTHTLESLDAQTLTANAPNASELRSVLKRFTAAAIDTDVALVYYDGTVLKIGDRDFVAPGGIELRRPSDLLTKAIPLSALARATALAVNGGAVLVHSSAQDIQLIDGVTLVETAPEARSGTSPILFADTSAALDLADGLEAMAKTDGDIDLGDALRSLAGLDGVSISRLPSGNAMLRKMPVPTVAQMPGQAAAAPANPVDQTATTSESETGITLPQVGDDSASGQAQEESAAEATLPVANALTEPDTTEAETGTSLEVLKAIQDGLPRSQKRILQRHLRNMGFYRGLIDGIFGLQTERAISAYQESVGAPVTGILNEKQLEDLSD